jgi:hypothetical protein
MAFLASCGHSLGDDFGWPGEDGRTICYPCFEAQADASWWRRWSTLSQRSNLPPTTTSSRCSITTTSGRTSDARHPRASGTT